eukprot:gene29872-25505_t
MARAMAQQIVPDPIAERVKDPIAEQCWCDLFRIAAEAAADPLRSRQRSLTDPSNLGVGVEHRHPPPLGPAPPAPSLGRRDDHPTVTVTGDR